MFPIVCKIYCSYNVFTSINQDEVRGYVAGRQFYNGPKKRTGAY